MLKNSDKGLWRGVTDLKKGLWNVSYACQVKKGLLKLQNHQLLQFVQLAFESEKYSILSWLGTFSFWEKKNPQTV